MDDGFGNIKFYGDSFLDKYEKIYPIQLLQDIKCKDGA